jgi:hypothetical protein
MTSSSGVEKRIQFIILLQAAEMAFIGVLIAQRKDDQVVAGVALTLGIPTLVVAYLAYRRALDFMIQHPLGDFPVGSPP